MGFLMDKGVYLQDFLNVTKVDYENIYVNSYRSPYINRFTVTEMISNNRDISKIRIFNMNIVEGKVYLEID